MCLFFYSSTFFFFPSFNPTDVKTTGSWTRALQKQEGDNLIVHVDGFYGGGSTLASMKNAEGFQRVVLFAGGSGVTSFTAMIQVRQGVYHYDSLDYLLCLLSIPYSKHQMQIVSARLAQMLDGERRPRS